MTNFEKYKDVVLSIADKEDFIAIVDDKLTACSSVICTSCKNNDYGGRCTAAFIRWLYEEYQEKPKLSERAYHFLKSLPEGASIEHSEGRLYMRIGHNIVNTSRCSEFVPDMPLQPDVWYEISDLLEWEVIKDE